MNEESGTFEVKPLVDEELYLLSGVHIGTRQKSLDMEPFFYRVRSDGLYILDIRKTDERIRVVAKMLARYEPDSILIVSARQYGQFPAEVFAKTIGAKVIAGRFMPGMLTNPNALEYTEPQILFVTDPIGDSQAMREAMLCGIPIIALCDANNETKFVDLIIPTNNKGRRSLAFIYWLLSREVLKARGVIKSDEEYTKTIEEFEAPL
jgi:small subunit ribosomal protein S2